MTMQAMQTLQRVPKPASSSDKGIAWRRHLTDANRTELQAELPESATRGLGLFHLISNSLFKHGEE